MLTLTTRCLLKRPMIGALAVSLILLGMADSVQAQFALSQERLQRTNFEFQSRTQFEPMLRTNFEPKLPSSFGFQEQRSAANVRLTERLNQLQPRLPEEKQYVADVIRFVDENRLPETVVNQAFFYSIQRYGNAFSFAYFERILQIQAERSKATAPTFDRTIYSQERFRPQVFNQ